MWGAGGQSHMHDSGDAWITTGGLNFPEWADRLPPEREDRTLRCIIRWFPCIMELYEYTGESHHIEIAKKVERSV